MAPEQATGRAEAIGPATDVYALGAILYRLLTAAPPFQGKDLFETVEQVQTLAPVPPRKLQPAVPRDLEAICLKCLAKGPARRYSSAAELADDLDRFLAGDAVRARPAPTWERTARVVRRRPAFIVLGLLLVTLAVVAVWYWHTHWRVTVEYYANAVSRWGVPEGVGLLTAEQVRHRGQSLRFYKRAGRVERVETINALGHLTDRPVLSGPIATPDDLAYVSRHVCAFDYKRDESGRLTDEIARNALGEVVWSLHYTDADTALYKDQRGLPRPPVASGATYVRFDRTPDGLTREQHFLDGARRPKPDARGVYGERREFDGRGFITRLTTLGQDEKPAPSRLGPGVIKFDYDEQGNVTQLSHHDPDDRPATAPQNFSRVELGYDEWGNLTRMTYFGLDGRRCVRTDGYAEFVMKLNERGERVYAECHGVDEKRVACTEGFARMCIRYDDNSHPVEIRYLDADDRSCNIKDGYAILRLTFDKRGFPTRAEYFDQLDRRCKSTAGYARVDRTVSDDGRTVVTHVYGPDDRPCGDASGVECWTVRYDEHGQEIERLFSTAAGAPFISTEGYAGWRKRHDENGNVTECAFLGTDSQPCHSVSGVARWTARYDEFGRESALTCFNLAGQELRRTVVVTRVVADSQAEKLGVRLDDVLLTYAGSAMTAVEDYVALRRAEPPDGPPHELVVARNGSHATLQLPPGILGMDVSNRWVPK
jgi:YD repeat-containing protein